MSSKDLKKELKVALGDDFRNLDFLNYRDLNEAFNSFYENEKASFLLELDGIAKLSKKSANHNPTSSYKVIAQKAQLDKKSLEIEIVKNGVEPIEVSLM